MRTFLAYILWLKKAILAFISPGAVVIGSAVLEKSPGGTSITTAEWITAAVACIVTSAAVGAATNGPRPGQ